MTNDQAGVLIGILIVSFIIGSALPLKGDADCEKDGGVLRMTGIGYECVGAR